MSLPACPQVYLAALEHAFLRAMAAPAGREEAALDMFGELGRCVAQAHSGIVAGAGVALARIVKGGIDFALQARCRPCASSIPQAFCGCRLVALASSLRVTISDCVPQAFVETLHHPTLS